MKQKGRSRWIAIERAGSESSDVSSCSETGSKSSQKSRSAVVAAKSGTKSTRKTAMNIFLKHTKVYIDEDGKQQVDVTGVISRPCYLEWLESREKVLPNPEEQYRDCVASHITNRQNSGHPFPALIEEALIKLLRPMRKVWPCFEGCFTKKGRRIRIGTRGLETIGYHEARRKQSNKSSEAENSGSDRNENSTIRYNEKQLKRARDDVTMESIQNASKTERTLPLGQNFISNLMSNNQCNFNIIRDSKKQDELSGLIASILNQNRSTHLLLVPSLTKCTEQPLTSLSIVPGSHFQHSSPSSNLFGTSSCGPSLAQMVLDQAIVKHKYLEWLKGSSPDEDLLSLSSTAMKIPPYKRQRTSCIL